MGELWATDELPKHAASCTSFESGNFPFHTHKVPTKIGVVLSLHAYQRLCHVVEFLGKDLEELANELESESHLQHGKDEALEAHHAQIRARREDTAAVCSVWSMDGVFVIYMYHTYISVYSHIYCFCNSYFCNITEPLHVSFSNSFGIFVNSFMTFFYFRDICFHNMDPCCFDRHLFRILKNVPISLLRISFIYTHTHIYIYIYSISQEICPRFLLCCALLWLYIDWFSHTHQAYFTGTVAI